MKEKGVGIRSLIRNILGVRRVCWSSGTGIRMNDKWVNYSYQFATKQQVVGYYIIETLLVHR